MPVQLKNVKAIVAGGTGAVGEGIVKALMREGATVIVPVRDIRKADNLKDFVSGLKKGELHIIPANISDYQSARAFFDKAIADFNKIDIAVAALGGFYRGGRLDQVPISEWNSVLQNNLTSHFIFGSLAMNHFYQSKSGMLVQINSSAMENIQTGQGIISMTANAEKTMSLIFANEARGTNVRVYCVALLTPVKTRARGKNVRPNWISADQAGQYIIRLFRKKALDIDQPVHLLTSAEQI